MAGAVVQSDVGAFASNDAALANPVVANNIIVICNTYVVAGASTTPHCIIASGGTSTNTGFTCPGGVSVHQEGDVFVEYQVAKITGGGSFSYTTTYDVGSVSAFTTSVLEVSGVSTTFLVGAVSDQTHGTPTFPCGPVTPPADGFAFANDFNQGTETVISPWTTAAHPFVSWCNVANAPAGVPIESANIDDGSTNTAVTVLMVLQNSNPFIDFQANIVGHASITADLEVDVFVDFAAAIVGRATVAADLHIIGSPTQAVLGYTATIQGIAGGNVATAMGPSEVPLPFDFLFGIGVRRITDVVTGPSGGPPATVVRTVTLGLLPSVTPTATLTRRQGQQGGPLTSVTLTNRGQKLVHAPVWEVTETATVPAGTEAGDLIIPIRNAVLKSTLRALSVSVLLQGTSYSPTPTLTPIGGVVANAGTPMKLRATVIMGHITGVIIDDPGKGYFSPPTSIVITDATGSGAELDIANMEIDTLEIVDPGAGYVNPVVAAIPFFKFTWPDSIGITAQEEPFFDLLTNGLQSSASTPIVAAEPELS